MSEVIENTVSVETSISPENVDVLGSTVSNLTPTVTEPAESTVDCETLLSQGKRNLMCGEIQTAVNQLNEVCRLLATKFGDEADQCAEALLFYGTSLLELARMENSVLGNALQGMSEEVGSPDNKDDSITEPDEVTEEEKKKISDEIIDAMTGEGSETVPPVVDEKTDGATLDQTPEPKDEEKASESGAVDAHPEQTDASVAATEGANTTSGKEATKEEATKEEATKEESKEEATKEEATKEEATKEEATKEESATETKEDEEEEMDGEDDEEDTEEAVETTEEADVTAKTEEDDISNLQLAWETLELSKKIYQRQQTKEAHLKLADCHLRLGEVGLETEHYSQAAYDFRECLRILSETLEPTHRRLAETHYQVALACGFNGCYDDAVAHYRSAVTIIQTRIADLRRTTETSSEAGGEKKPNEDVDKEIQDLESLIPDIMTKIEDAEEEKSAAHLKDVIRDSVHPMETVHPMEAVRIGVTTTGFGDDGAQSLVAPTEAAQLPVHNVSHLVRKKRKPEDEVDSDEVKKAKTSDEASSKVEVAAEVTGQSEKVNGHEATNGHIVDDVMNGKKESEEEKMEVEPPKMEIEVEPLPAKSVEEVKKLSETTESA